MGVGSIIVMAAIGVVLAALYYEINIFDIFLVGPALFTFLSVTVGLIVVVVARRRSGVNRQAPRNPREKQDLGSRWRS